MSKTKQGGFTLIELLVVVAIISLLAAIAIPNFMGRLRIARMTKAEAEIKSFEQAVEMFYTDTGYLPFWSLRRYGWNQWPNDTVANFYLTFQEAGQLYGTPMLSAILMTTRVYADAGLFRGGVADTESASGNKERHGRHRRRNNKNLREPGQACVTPVTVFSSG